MKLIRLHLILLSIVVSLFISPGILGVNTNNEANEAKILFWDAQQKGTNIFNQSISLEDIRAAKKYKIKFIRLAPDKFISTHRDFLIGNADDYQGLIKEDLEKLKQILDLCLQEKIPVVITMLSLPGSRWKQNNKNQDDLRIWKEEKFRQQAALFWKELATELRDHPAIIGYNILNEPHPEKLYSPKNISIINKEEIQLMLYEFYETIIKNIRMVDPNTPVILDSSAYADSQTFEHFKPHDDEKIIYSFHIYEPYEYTNYKMNQGKLHYPGYIGSKYWNKKELRSYVEAVIKFQQIYNISSHRILVGEFGGNRMSPGLNQYFKDLIAIFNEESWHFAFYAFREDTWDGMDYELGNKKLPWSYWQTVESGKKPLIERKDIYPAFSVIKEALN